MRRDPALCCAGSRQREWLLLTAEYAMKQLQLQFRRTQYKAQRAPHDTAFSVLFLPRDYVPSEDESQAKLQSSWTILLIANLSKGRIVDRSIRWTELNAIEGVERLSTELHFYGVMNIKFLEQ